MTRRKQAVDPDRLIDLIYDAAIDPAAWPATLREIAEAIGSSSVLLFTPHDLGRHGDGWQSHNIDHAMFGPYVAHYAQHDIPNAVANDFMRRTGQSHSVLVLEQFVTREKFEASVFYNEFFAPQGIGTVTSIRSLADPRLGMPTVDFATFRPPGAEPTGPLEQRLLELLAPHLRRALHLQARLAESGRKAEAAFTALDHLPVGVALLDEAGVVVHLNPEAQRIVRQSDGFTGSRRRLSAGRFDHVLQRALSEPNGATLTVPRPSGLADYLIVITPLHAHDQRIGQRRICRIVFITDPEVRPVLRQDVMRQLWRLTAAEARVAAALIEGLAPKEIAVRNGVSEPTVRTQMRAIFAKTGTTKQADLMRLVAMVAGLRHSQP